MTLRTIRKILLWVCATMLAIVALTYAADGVYVQVRGRPTEQMRVDRVYTAMNRYNEVEYSIGTPISQTCVDALMPHFGYVPCWYLRRHTLQQVKTY